ncbi:MAG: hypothetical protein OCC49_13560 [Fibrobacterales bacterium]
MRNITVKSTVQRICLILLSVLCVQCGYMLGLENDGRAELLSDHELQGCWQADSYRDWYGTGECIEYCFYKSTARRYSNSVDEYGDHKDTLDFIYEINVFNNLGEFIHNLVLNTFDTVNNETIIGGDQLIAVTTSQNYIHFDGFHHALEDNAYYPIDSITGLNKDGNTCR